MRIAIAAVLLLTGCNAVGLSSHGGGLPGAREVAIGPNFVPAPIVEALDDRPLGALVKAEQDALGSAVAGEEVSFASGGVRGRVVAGPVYMVNARTCRKLMHVAERDGRRLSGQTTLCLSDEGRWEPVG